MTKFKDSALSNELVSEFESNTDMYGALCASSQILFMSCPNFFYTHRNHKCLDGGLTWNWVKLNENTLVISPYKWNRIKGKINASDALIANTEELVYALILQGYINPKHNDSDFVKCGLEKKSKL